MNCKPGDLAVVVRAEKNPAWLGRIVKVVEEYDAESWVTDPVPLGYSAIMDDNLRPIRPQRDDAVDEMVQLLGKPEAVTA